MPESRLWEWRKAAGGAWADTDPARSDCFMPTIKRIRWRASRGLALAEPARSRTKAVPCAPCASPKCRP